MAGSCGSICSTHVTMSCISGGILMTKTMGRSTYLKSGLNRPMRSMSGIHVAQPVDPLMGWVGTLKSGQSWGIGWQDQVEEWVPEKRSESQRCGRGHTKSFRYRLCEKTFGNFGDTAESWKFGRMMYPDIYMGEANRPGAEPLTGDLSHNFSCPHVRSWAVWECTAERPSPRHHPWVGS